MTAHMTRGVLYVHSSPRALCPHLEWAAGRALGRAVNFDWSDQPVLPGSLRTEYVWEGPRGAGAAIASALRGWSQVRYEVTEDAGHGCDGSRWLHTPDLGIFFAQTDAAGNIVVPEDRIRALLEKSGANPSGLQDGLRRALGQDWDDELEPFRYAGDEATVIWLHRVG